MDTNPFDKTPVSRKLYDELLEKVGQFGPVTEEMKRTSSHICAGGAAFLGVHPRSKGLLLNIVLDHRLESSRVVKREQVSKNRYHNEIYITEQSELDKELVDWIGQAYQRVLNRHRS